ncbi:uncharacterized protein LOC143854059 [Tasmannia lanceolata]|uniref:uncharacterized protein LOC143854059 n=1 Tax=Tasmannia lanceolata TaxID=3420 RepID=UPI004063BB57
MGKIAVCSAKKGEKTQTKTKKKKNSTPPQPKKKGRPSRADLALRRPESDTSRRNLRRRREESESESESENRRKKKIKLVLKLPPFSHSYNKTSQVLEDKKTGFGNIRSTVAHLRAQKSSSCSFEYENGNKPLKKRKIEGDGDVDGDDVDGHDGSDDIDDDDDDDLKGREGNGIPKETDSVPGTLAESPSATMPFPERKLLELILDKLQKKDTYGVYAEPVDPEELPDYHDIIEHPMDFGTIRKKLSTGAYSCLEQFENDVFLVCTNAMQYNAPETIYFRQARSIQDLARKKFGELRGTEVDLKSLQETRSTLVSKSIKSLCRTVQEPVGSDMDLDATLTTKGDVCTRSNTAQPGDFEKSGNVDSPADGNSFMTENKLEKEEELSVKGSPSKSGKKLSVLVEHRRATYHVSNQPVARTELVFATFESEMKELVAVGLHADHSYARSLARFAATLGPVAWKVASKRIEEALPVGYRFGRGWIGEYEPLPTSILSFENHTKMQPSYNAHLRCEAEFKKNDNGEKWRTVQEGGPKNVKLGVKTPLGLTVENAVRKPANPKESIFGGVSGTKSIANVMYREQKNSPNMDFAKPNTTFLKEVDASDSSPVTSVPTRGLPNGKVVRSSESGRVAVTSLDFVSNHQTGGPGYFPQVNNGQGLDDPVKLMRMFAGKLPNQTKYSNSTTVDGTQIMSSMPLSRRDDPNASATAARTWMSIGAPLHPVKPKDSSDIPKMQISAASLYNPTRELTPTVSQFHENASRTSQSEKNLFAPQALPQPVHVSQEPLVRNVRPMVFPQLVATDSNLSRFQVRSPWQGLVPHTQQRQKTDMLPPDLNIVFQSSPGSPVRQSSSILVDSQQPDLALQL